MKILKFLWVLGSLKTVSKNPSSPLRPYNQLYIKWTFYNIIQYPLFAQSNNYLFAGSSCPYPIEILINLLFELDISN